MSYFRTLQSLYIRMILSKRCEYGLRAALYLAADGRGEYVAIRSISDELKIPYPFLAKTVQSLTQAGLLASQRGPTGGIKLARPASQITLEAIVLAIDGPEIFTECVLGLPGCGDRKPCPLHDQWAPTRQRLHHMFAAASLDEMASRIQAHDFRLADLDRVSSAA